ncbi:hypothetical protein [Bacillus paralicheniformis]|uniref:hypothetical protein n=1 Tax=Bacillus paralicheniformis TaxID=1648923 RepID=UPI00128D9BEF|nr:hypothetical protein [Bacillus paralicheniformis]MPQ23776.1 hypothetical protein [Bacillus paralicheniformis]
MGKSSVIIWLFLGAVSLWIKQSLDLTVWKNEGRSLNVAAVFTNNTPADSILWISYTLFGALFVLRKISNMRALYQLFPGRITSRKRLIIKEMTTIYQRTGAYVLLGLLATIWQGHFTSGTFYSFLYAWIALVFLITLLLIFENLYGVWLLLLIFSTVPLPSLFSPWMYGHGYEIWEQGTTVSHTTLLLVLITGSVFIYFTKMKTADWGK